MEDRIEEISYDSDMMAQVFDLTSKVNELIIGLNELRKMVESLNSKQATVHRK